jgi:hypothetical protein
MGDSFPRGVEWSRLALRPGPRPEARKTKRRERLTAAERREYDRAVEWAQWARMGTNDLEDLPAVAASENGSQREAATDAELNEWSVPGSNR